MVGFVFMFTVMVFNIHFPTVYAFTQEIVEAEHYGKVNSMIEIQGQTSSMLAGALAAFLMGGTRGKLSWLSSSFGIEIEPWGIHEIFLLDGITYVIAYFMIYSIKYSSFTVNEYVAESLRNRFKVGIDFFRENRSIMWFGLLSFSVFIVTIVEGFYLAAIYVSDYLKEDSLVYTSAELLYAGGALVAGLFIRKIFYRIHSINAILFIMLFLSAGFFICGTSQSSYVFIIFNFFLGLANAGTRVLRITYLFKLIPNKIIGRVNGIFASYQTLIRGLFILLFSIPFFMEGQNIRIAFMIFAAFLVFSAILLFLLTRKLRENESQ
jgi:MFS family permease